jgi:hypothetical protein
MSKWSDDPDEINQRIWRGLIVQEHGPEGIDCFEYMRRAKHNK